MGFKIRKRSKTGSSPQDDARESTDSKGKKKKKKGTKSRGRIAAAKGLAVLPSLFTLGNCLCGFAAIFLASKHVPDTPDPNMPFGWTPLTFSALFIFLGMVFDGLDGTVARLTRQTSDLGGQLDSMCDMVTFGVAPAFMAVILVGVETPFLSPGPDNAFHRAALLIGGIYVSCTALRLARFNLEIDNPEERDHMSFKGLPSPGAAGTIASMVLLHEHFKIHLDPLARNFSSVGMVALMLLVSFAMVSRMRYVHVINRYMRGRAPAGTIAIVISVGLLLAIWPQRALATGLVLYAVSAPIGAGIRKLLKKSPKAPPVPLPAQSKSTSDELSEEVAQQHDDG